MRTSSRLAGIVAAFIVCGVANAAYVGLSLTAVHTTVVLDPKNPSPVPVTIHRVWALFTNPNDALLVWGGGGSLGTGIIHNVNVTGTPGSGFLNNINGGILPPNASVPTSNSDSYFTIGVTLQNQIPAGQGINLLTIGMPLDVTGTTIDLSTNGGGAVFTPELTATGAANPITLAGFTGDGDPALRILLMQLVVPQGEQVYGYIGIFINQGKIAGGNTILQNQFFGLIPVPGAFAVLTLAGLVGPRRCRK